MSDGQILWYRTRSSKRSFQRLVSAFGEAGIALTHPATGRAVLLNVDGDQFQTSPSEVANMAGSALCDLNIQFWYSADTDLTCSISYRPFGWEKHTYHLDGLSREERERCLRVVREEVFQHAAETIALVVDRSGRTAELDWDKVVDDARFELDEQPDVLVLNRTVFRDLPDADEAEVSKGLGSDLQIVSGSISWNP